MMPDETEKQQANIKTIYLQLSTQAHNQALAGQQVSTCHVIYAGGVRSCK